MPDGHLASFPAGLRRELAAWPTLDVIAPDGSDRRFFRLRRGDSSCICLYHPQPPGAPVSENDSYYFIGQHLRRQGLPVPEIFAYCRQEGWFLLEDLGDTSLQEACQRQPDRAGTLTLYRQAVQLLVDLQQTGTQGFDPGWCFDTPSYTAELVYTRECLYFQQAFLQGYLGWEHLPGGLARDFAYLLERALEPGEQVLLHRDFQSRNLLVHKDRLWLIDFQGARLGPPHYDLAALLLDPYVQLPPDLQEDLVEEYLSLWQRYTALNRLAWRQRYHYVALCRNLQILGAYGFLCRRKGKPFFRQFIPAACGSLLRRLEALPTEELPTLRDIARQAWEQLTAPKDGATGLP